MRKKNSADGVKGKKLSYIPDQGYSKLLWGSTPSQGRGPPPALPLPMHKYVLAYEPISATSLNCTFLGF